jgi:Tol biopolymer transport system component
LKKQRGSLDLARRWPGILAVIGAALVFLAVADWRFGLLKFLSPPPAPAISATFTTNPSDAPAEADSPLQVNAVVALPVAAGGPRVLPLVDWQLRDEAGQPAVYGDQPGPRTPMNVTSTVNGWRADTSAPSKPGRYHVHLFVAQPGEAAQEYDLTTPALQVVAAAPMTGGLVYQRSGNLWRTDATGRHTRRLTFYGSDGRADWPAWNPDGAALAYARTLPAPADQVPFTELWQVDPNTGISRQLVARREGEDLTQPAFAPDTRLFYTAVRTFDPATGATPTSDALTSARESRNVEQGSGTDRRPFLAQAQQLDISRDGKQIVYLATPDAAAESNQPVTHTLMIAAGDGSNARVLVPAGAFYDIHAPHLSPDGTQVLFSAVNASGVPDGLNLLQMLGLAPLPAYANGVPWDLYLVPAAGGTPTRLTKRQDDQPYAVWSGDGKRIAFLDERGLYLLDLTQPGAEEQKIGPAAGHSQIAWYER